MKVQITQITKIILDFMFVAGIVIILTLPFSLKWYGNVLDYQLVEYLWQMVVIFAICGVFALLIVWELRKIFTTVLAEDCFVRRNVTSLNRMGNYAFIIAVIMIARCIFYITLAALAMVIVFIIAGLFSKVLAQVFDKAVSYKLENDLTI